MVVDATSVGHVLETETAVPRVVAGEAGAGGGGWEGAGRPRGSLGIAATSTVPVQRCLHESGNEGQVLCPVTAFHAAGHIYTERFGLCHRDVHIGGGEAA